MADANDTQMQVFHDDRVRQVAELARLLVNRIRDDKAAIGPFYNRAVNGPAWNDSRTDGPPKLLTGQDTLVYNTIITNLLACVAGTNADGGTLTANGALAIVQDISANWETFRSACVRAVS